MKVAHLLRKYNPNEWGGTESAVLQLMNGLKDKGVQSVVFAPKIKEPLKAPDILTRDGHEVRRFSAFIPTLGLSKDDRKELFSVGGNIMSFSAPMQLIMEPDISIIHTHALNRLGGVARLVAGLRRLPLVVTIHGGYYDLPKNVRSTLNRLNGKGIEWGKVIGFFLGSREVLTAADAVVTCNPREAQLLRENLPNQCIVQMPHAIPIAEFGVDRRAHALKYLPHLTDHCLLLMVGRIDPVKNQAFVVEQMPVLLGRDKKAILVLVGAITDHVYYSKLIQRISELRLKDHVFFTGGIPSSDPLLVGLYQQAEVVLVPSLSETFGLVLIEALAAGTPVVSSKTSGALQILEKHCTAWLFDIEDPAGFHKAVNSILNHQDETKKRVQIALSFLREQYDIKVVAKQFLALYEQVIQAHKAKKGFR